MSNISKLIKALEVIRLDARGKYSFFKKGYSLSSIKVVSGVRRFCGDVKTIIDVGANIGQFTIASAMNSKAPTSIHLSLCRMLLTRLDEMFLGTRV